MKAELHDGTILEFPDGTSPEVVQTTVKRVLAEKNPTTVLGYAKEAVKGIPRGFMSGLEQAATGAAALLPEEYEKPVVAKAQELAERFSPKVAPGYEDAITTKLGEGLGSMGTFIVPGGLPARTLMAGAMGAGEARQRAQQAGATPEQISEATAQGILPGLTDIVPVERLINGLGKTVIKGFTTRLVRMAETGGLEGAQEMAQNIGQNLIAQGYNPEQGTFTGTGEAGAYGAGVGAIAQGLMDLAFGRRAPSTRNRVDQSNAPIEAIPQAPVEAIPQVEALTTGKETPLQDGVAAGVKAIKDTTPAAAPAAPVVPVAGAATFDELRTKHGGFKPFMTSPDATPANMRVWYAGNERRLATGKEGPKIASIKKQQEQLIKALAAAPAAPAAAAPAAPAATTPVVTVPAAPAAEADVAPVDVAPAVDPKTLLKPPVEVPNADAQQLNANAPPTGAIVPVQPPATEGRTPLATNGTGVADNLGAADNTSKGEIEKPVALDLKATVVEPDAAEVAKRAAAEAEKLAQSAAATSKRVIKKSEAGIAKELAAKKLADEAADKEKAAKAAAAKKVADKELADKEKTAKAAADKKLADEAAVAKAAVAKAAVAKAAEPTTPKEKFPPATVAQSLKVMESTKDIKEFETQLDYITADPKGKDQKRIPAWVTPKQVEDSFKRNARLANKDEMRGITSPTELVAAVDRIKDSIASYTKAYNNAEEDGDTDAQRSTKSRLVALNKTLTNLKGAAKIRGVALTGKRVAAEYIRQPKGNQPRMSLAGESALRTDHTAKEVADVLRKEFGDTSGFDKLVTVHQTESDLLAAYPEIAKHRDYYPGVRGVAHKGRVHLVADQIERGQELGVFLHEAGAHLGFDRLEKEGNLDRKFLVDQVYKWAAGDDMKAEVAQVAIAKGINDDEIIAYTVEGLVTSGVTPTGFRLESTWLRKIMAAFQTLLNKLGMRHDITPQELVDLAAGAAHITIESTATEDIAMEVFAEPKTRFEEGVKASWFSKVRNMATRDIQNHDVVPIGAYGPVKNAGVVFNIRSSNSFPTSIEVVVIDMDAPAGLPFVDTHVDTLFAAPSNLDRSDAYLSEVDWADTDLGTSGVLSTDPNSYVRKKYKDDLYLTNGYVKWKDGVVGVRTVRMGFRTLRHWIDKVGVLDDVQMVHFVRHTGALSGQENESSYPRSVFMRFSKPKKTSAPSVEVNEKTGMVEIVRDGKVVYEQQFAKPALLAHFKGDTLDRMIAERSREVKNSDEFDKQLYKIHDAWMEEQPFTPRELVHIAIQKAASGYKYGDELANTYLANSDGGRIANVRPSLRSLAGEMGNDTRGRTQKQIADDIIAATERDTPRFSQSNPALAAGMGTAQQLFKGPSAPMGLIDSAVRTASGVRQSMANKLEWWTDKATRVYGNLATDATGEASMRDRIEAASKVTHIALSKLMLGGLRKEKGFWEAYKTDHSYQDILNKLEEGVGKYAETPDFESMNKAFNMAATARREFELIKDKQMTWQMGKVKGEVNPTLDVNTQAKGITPQMDAGMRIYNEVPEIKEALAIFEKFNNDGVDQLAKAGVIDQKTADMLKGTTGYVPWFREADDAEGNIKLNALSPSQFTRGLINKSNLRELEGRSAEDAQISNVLNNMAKLSGWMTSKTVGNDTAAYMVDFATKFGVAGKPFAKKVGMGQPNSVLVLENGVPTYYAFDDPMALPAFRGYESAHSAITQFLSAPANLVRAGVTAFPVFSISQLPQDAMRAFIDSDLKNPYALIPRILKNFVVELVGGGTESGKTLSKFGIVGRGGDIMPGEATRSLRRRLGHYDTGMGGTARKFWDKLEKLQAASDAASRTALYELTMEETKSKAFPDGNQALAIRKAREIINFDTQGSSGYSTFLRQTVPFMGVSMIALNNLYKGLVLGQRLSDKEASAARRSIIYHGTQIAVLTMLYTMLVGDTDDYKKLSDSERNRNFIIPGTGLSIPVPGDGLGFMFKVIPEQIARYTLAEGLESKDAGSKAGRALYKGLTNIGSFESYIPVVGSPLPKTFVELVLNENWYTGNAIVGKSKENLTPSQQYTDSTSEIAKQLGQALNLSPLKLDYIVRAMTGQLGGFTFAMTEAAMNAAQGKVTPSWDIRTFPGMSAFTYPSGKDRAALEDFYELRERVDVVARTYSDLARVGKGKEALAYLAEGDNKRAYALRQFQTEAEKGLAKFRAARTLIINNPNIKTGEEMKQQLKELDDRENAYLKSMRLPDKREFAYLTPKFDLNILKAFR